MKSSTPSPSSARTPTERTTAPSHDSEASITRSADTGRTPSFRPSLVRSPPVSEVLRGSRGDVLPPGELEEESETAGDSTGESDTSSSNRALTSSDEPDAPTVEQRRKKSVLSMREELDMAKSREAVNTRILLGQQRTRMGSHGGGSNSPRVPGPKRVSPIKEETPVAMSPSPNAAFRDPLPTGQSTSTGSSSAKTVKGSVPPTPSNLPIRTPSYPFPYVPGTPRVWSAAFHQPFTALSPTVTERVGGDRYAQTESALSGTSTPVAGIESFMPAGVSYHSSEDPRYPTPNLYDMVLQLNGEPGLDSWWNTVTQLLHEMYKAERVTLAIPADENDIENVPWGQKATFNIAGPMEHVQSAQFEAEEAPQTPSDLPLRWPHTEVSRSSTLHAERLRPRLETRHSFAGHERDKKDSPSGSSQRSISGRRPQGPHRTVSHAPSLAAQSRRPTQQGTFDLPPHITLRQTSLDDPEFSSVGEEVYSGPHAEVFPFLRSFAHEPNGLIDEGGVNRILERGKLVTLTRDYSSDASTSTASDRSVGTKASNTHSQSGKETRPPQQPPSSRYVGEHKSGLSTIDDSSHLNRRSTYEEYEQFPTSPWAQSPAPSPAIQADPESNPFFTLQSDVDDSFNPTVTSPDYSQFGFVEAIGVDRASTIIHVPLIHPVRSQQMQALQLDSPQTPGGSRESKKKRQSDLNQPSEQPEIVKRAPIAILSILSPTVPYPQNLTQSLKLLGPHLATTYSNAEQFASLTNRALRHRRTISGHNVGLAPMVVEPTHLDDLMQVSVEELDESITSSMTSPSDYSGRSRQSPGGSLGGTPGWDTSTFGLVTNRSVVNTPTHHTGAEIIDSYFDAKKRTALQRASSSTAARPGNQSHSVERRSTTKKSLAAHEEDPGTPKRERKPKASFLRDERSPHRAVGQFENSPTRTGQTPISRYSTHPHPSALGKDDGNHRHSLLHSYGADFSSTFQTLPTATGPKSTSPGPVPTHGRRSSLTDDVVMPPPSERLLRTITDSLPVQIFTAQPGTGEITWVNSKFLVYRGHNARQVVTEPWQAIHPEDRTAYMETWHRSLRTGQQLQQKVRLQRFDGAYRWFYVRAAPLRDKRQNIVHWMGTNMDFHEQHIAETNSARQQETAASEAKYRALANSSPQIVFAVNKLKGVTFCNSQWVMYSGQTEAQALGLGFMDHVHPDDLIKCRLPQFDEDSDQVTNVPTTMPPEPRRMQSMSNTSSSGSSETEKVTSPGMSSPIMPLPQRQLSQLASTGILKVTRDAEGRPSYSTEVRLRSKEGDFRWHLVRVLLAEPQLSLDRENEEETWYGTCTDINDHKALERDLKETMDEKSRFLSNMSHEIRTPLNGITGMVNFLIDSSLSAEQMEHVNIIRASTEGLRGLINDILDLSKAEAGMIQLAMNWMHVRSLIEEVNDLTSAMAIDKGLELNYLVEEDVPATVKGDRFRVRQILLNVIGNAIKFTQKGEVFVRCRMKRDEVYSVGKNETMIQFDIIDTGTGFTDKEAEYLFKRFSQIDGSSTRQHGGTGLGLVISRQLAQLHGGDMSAKGVPGSGSTFTFFIKTTLPSDEDRPPAQPMTPSAATLPQTPMTPASSYPLPIPARMPSLPMSVKSGGASPRFLAERTASPSPYLTSPADRESPAVSSASSDPSIRSVARTSVRSERSSASSYVPEPSLFSGSLMKLAMPPDSKMHRTSTSSSLSSMGDSASMETIRPAQSAAEIRTFSPGGSSIPPMYSILVACPLRYSRDATVHHINMTLPKNIPHQITPRASLLECQRMIGGEDPITFTHIVLVLQDVTEIVAFMDQVLSLAAHSATSLVIITDLTQKRKIMDQAPDYDYEQLIHDRRIRFIFKPLKPSKFAVIFDPRKEREMSTDRNQDSAQQVAVSQKQVFEEVTRRLGNKDKRVLLVEDNRVNQMVLLKFLGKVAMNVETALDGVICTEKVFAKPHDYYSIILCDLHMPNKDGYQTCKEIRRWEKKNKYGYIPIIALSANVLGDVYTKCVEAGFNSYVTKPVDFKELSQELLLYLDPADPSKPHEFMRAKKAH
ncbi:hypothetical protein LTR66_003578 [Elasticomyces elasticus]|nr:hypothetical protein LTR66_003578 [Elasticomyces elasticus]